MRKLLSLTLASSAVVAIACGRDKSPTSAAMSADLKRDLQLASTTQDIRISPDEISPSSKPEASLRPKAAPQGPKVVRSAHPTVKASAKPVEVAEAPAQVPQVEVMATAPAPSTAESPAPDLPPLARPSPMPSNGPGSGAGQMPGAGQGSGGSAGGILGGIIGAVIRGGMIGDDDHCDPRGGHGRPRGGVPIGGDVYYPAPGGMGGARFPTRGRP